VKKKQTNRKNKELGYINYHRTKSVTIQPIFFLAKHHFIVRSPKFSSLLTEPWVQSKAGTETKAEHEVQSQESRSRRDGLF